MSESKSKEEDTVTTVVGGIHLKNIDEILTEIGFGWYQVQLVAILCVGGLASAIQLTLLSLKPCAEVSMDLTTFETSFSGAAIFLGEVIGALTFGILADHRGRKYAYALSLMYLVGFGVGTACSSTSYAVLVLCQIGVGFGIGGGIVSFDYIAEAMSPKFRGKACMIQGMLWGVGSLYTTGMAWIFLEDYGWHFVAFMCTLPIVLALLAVFTIPESPRWLLLKGRAKEAKEALGVAAKRNGVELGDYTLKPVVAKLHEGGPKELFKKGQRWQTTLLILIWNCTSFGYISILLVIATLFEESDDCYSDYGEVFIATLSESPIFVVFVFLCVERSRQWTDAISHLGAGVFVLLLGTNLSGSWREALSFVAGGCIRVGYSAVWTITSELLPTEIRVTAHAFFYVISRLGAYMATYWLYSDVSNEGVCALIAAICIGAAILATMLKETAVVILDDHAELNKSNAERSEKRRNSMKTLNIMFRSAFKKASPNADDTNQRHQSLLS